MKIILFQNNNPFTTNSAYANRITALILGLQKEGAEVVVFMTDGYKTITEKKQFKKRGNYNGIQYEYLLPINNTNLWIRRLNTYVLFKFYAFVLKLRITTLLKNTGMAIIWPTDELNILKSFDRKLKKEEHFYFYEICEYFDIHKISKNNWIQNSFAEKRMYYFDHHFLPLIDGMAFITNTLYNFYAPKVSESTRMLILPMIVDFDRFIPKQNRNYSFDLKKPYIAFTGIMNNEKDGVDILIESFGEIAEEFPDLNLYLFGFWHYDTPGHLIQIKSLNLENRVFYMGTVDRDTIPEIISSAYLLVLPRPDSHQAQGGFPTKLGEYLATGNPVCATKVGEIPDYLEDEISVFFAESKSIQSFAASMRKALSSPSKAIEVGKNGQKIARKYFDKNVLSVALFDFFSEALQNKNHTN